MIVVRVELWSAINGSKTELARMTICNDGSGDFRTGSYDGVTYVGRDTQALNRNTVSKRARVTNWRRNDFHVWNLVRLMLENMGYTKGVK